MPVPYYPEPSTHTTTPSQWGPYSGAGDFAANMIVILIVVFCAVVLALAINFVICYLFCDHRSLRGSPADANPEKPPLRNESDPTQTQIFSAGGTKLAGTEAECAICLIEFADGDRVHVVPACNHGFHVGCIERWLRTKSSCPMCRRGCQVAVGPTAAAAIEEGEGDLVLDVHE